MDYVIVAQLEGNRVNGVSQLKREGYVPSDLLVELESMDESLLGWTYERESGTFAPPSGGEGE